MFVRDAGALTCWCAQEYLDPATTITLMSSYDRMDEVLYYCELVKDYERIVSYHVQNRDCGAALAVMGSKDVRRACPPIVTAFFVIVFVAISSQISEDQAAEMFYKFTPALIQMDVSQTVKAWRRCKFLDPAKLIPSLVRYSARSGSGSGVHSEGETKSAETADEEAILSYLSSVIRRGKHKSAAVYNYLLSLYADRVTMAVHVAAPALCSIVVCVVVDCRTTTVICCC